MKARRKKRDTMQNRIIRDRRKEAGERGRGRRKSERKKERKQSTTFEKWKNYVVFFFADVIPCEKRENE